MQPSEEPDSSLEPTDHGTASPEDKDALRRSLQQFDENVHMKLSQEPVTFNIGEVKGKEIQFGDRSLLPFLC